MIGVDLTDFSRFNNERFTSFVVRSVEAGGASLGRGQDRAGLAGRDHRRRQPCVLRPAADAARVLPAAGRRAAGISSRISTGSRRARTPARSRSPRPCCGRSSSRARRGSIDPLGVSELAGSVRRDPVLRQPLRARAGQADRRPGGHPQARGFRSCRLEVLFSAIAGSGRGGTENRGLHDCLERSGPCRPLGRIRRSMPIIASSPIPAAPTTRSSA